MREPHAVVISDSLVIPRCILQLFKVRSLSQSSVVAMNVSIICWSCCRSDGRARDGPLSERGVLWRNCQVDLTQPSGTSFPYASNGRDPRMVGRILHTIGPVRSFLVTIGMSVTLDVRVGGWPVSA